MKYGKIRLLDNIGRD